jgi:hypothetical protein
VPKVEYSFVRATYNVIYSDALFFLNKAKQANVKSEDRNRYARASIILMAFYLESVSNRLFDEFSPRSQKRLMKRKNLPGPIKNFIAVYHKFYKCKFPLSIDGIKDIFLIRNEVIGHPSGSSVVAGTGVLRGQGLPRKGRTGKQNKYSKFIDFPYVYSLFKTEHAKTIFKEATNFVNGYCDLLEDRVPDKKVLDVIRPPKLGQRNSKKND